MSIKDLEIISVKLFLLREMIRILSWHGLRVGKKHWEMWNVFRAKPKFFILAFKDQRLVLIILSILLPFNASYILTTPATSLLPNSHYQTLILIFFQAYHSSWNTVLYPTHNLCHQSKPHSFSKCITDDQGYLGPFQNSRQIWYFLSYFILFQNCVYMSII